MQRSHACLLLFAAAGLAATPVLASRLVSQGVKGTKRECVYEPRPEDRGRPKAQRPTLQVGLGEPCPYYYPRPNNYQERIPRLATLVAQVRREGQTVCVYAYNGRRYSRTLEAARRCPLTPIF